MKSLNIVRLRRFESLASHDKYINRILEILPSGSGFNCSWQHIKTQQNSVEVFETDFHNMNNNGYYDGYTTIKVYIEPFNHDNFRLTCSGKQRYTSLNRDYWEDIIYHCLTGE